MAANDDILILGIESSCDDTAAAVVRRSADGACAILSNVIHTQYEAHEAFGGVVPEIAARSHVEKMDAAIAAAMEEAGIFYGDLTAIAATGGPGLVGGVMVGLSTAKAIAIGHAKPLLIINHLEAHALSARMTEPAAFPYLLLLVSGGHTQFIEALDVGQYRRLGTTIDDAAGEAFDKTAKLLGLGQPGGPLIEKAAQKGNSSAFEFPKPLRHRDGCDLSFSGLKTAVRLAAEAASPLSERAIADIAASFQAAVVDHLTARARNAIGDFKAKNKGGSLVVAGGVAANQEIRASLERLAAEFDWPVHVPPIRLCTDNGAMVAWAGAERLVDKAGGAGDFTSALSFAPRARWPLAPPIKGQEHGGGKKGPKA